MKIGRQFTVKGASPYKGISFKKVRSEIRNPNGSLIFELNNVEVPIKWSQVATDIIAQKYFRKAGVARYLKKIEENNLDRKKIRELKKRLFEETFLREKFKYLLKTLK